MYENTGHSYKITFDRTTFDFYAHPKGSVLVGGNLAKATLCKFYAWKLYLTLNRRGKSRLMQGIIIIYLFSGS